MKPVKCSLPIIFEVVALISRLATLSQLSSSDYLLCPL